MTETIEVLYNPDSGDGGTGRLDQAKQKVFQKGGSENNREKDIF